MVLFTDYLTIKNVNQEDYLKKNINNKKIPIELIKCTCCINHKNKYPITVDYSLKLETKMNCKCPCRHLARRIYSKNNKILKTYNYGEMDDSDVDDSDVDYTPSESLGSEDSSRSEDSDKESEDSFIDDSNGGEISPNTRKELDKIKKILIKSITNKLN